MILMMRVMSNCITLVSQIKPKINDVIQYNNTMIIQNVHADNSGKTGYDIMRLTFFFFNDMQLFCVFLSWLSELQQLPLHLTLNSVDSGCGRAKHDL